jgi:hypothetical protein
MYSSNGGGSGNSNSNGTSPPPPPPPSYATATARVAQCAGNSPPPALQHMNTEQLMEMLLHEISSVRELCGIHAEANGSLEALLAKERIMRRDAQERLRDLKAEAARLKLQLDRRRAEMRRDGLALPEVANGVAQQPLNIAAPQFIPPGYSPDGTQMSNGSMTASGGHSVFSSLQLGQTLLPSSAGSKAAAQQRASSQSSPEGTETSSIPTIVTPNELPASPTDVGQRDRLKLLLQSLDIAVAA